MNSLLFTILSIIALFYQVLTINEVTLLNYVPNILIAILIYSHFHLNLTFHTILFFMIGLALDTSNPPLFGTFTLTFMILSYLITIVRSHIDLRILANKLVLILVCNSIVYLLYYLFVGLTYNQDFLSLLIAFIVGTLLNTIISIIIVGILDFINLLKLEHPDV